MTGPYSLQNAWIPFLQRWDWKIFCTNTFRVEVHPDRAEHAWRVWIAMMNRVLYGHRWEKHGKGIFWGRVREFQQRGAMHYHGLLSGEGVSDLDCRRWESVWWRLAGTARMEPPRSQCGVQNYLVKHIALGSELDLDGPLLDGLSVEESARKLIAPQ